MNIKHALTPKDLANEVGLSPRRVQQLIQSRDIPALKGGKPYYISRTSADRFKKETLIAKIFHCRRSDFSIYNEFVSDFEEGKIQ